MPPVSFMNHPSAAPSRPSSAKDLFFAFSALALQGFGGVLAVGQVLPGPNVCNVALMVGDRFFGWRGALAALAGMMTVPLVIVLLVAAVYAEYATHPAVADALKGMGAVAAGLIAGTGLKLASALRVNPMGLPASAAVGICAFAAVALLRWP